MGPTDPTLTKNKKVILQNFGQLAFFYPLFSAFSRRANKTEHISNQNQEVFIVIIISYIFRIFLLFLLCKIIFLKRY